MGNITANVKVKCRCDYCGHVEKIKFPLEYEIKVELEEVYQRLWDEGWYWHSESRPGLCCPMCKLDDWEWVWCNVSSKESAFMKAFEKFAPHKKMSSEDARPETHTVVIRTQGAEKEHIFMIRYVPDDDEHCPFEIRTFPGPYESDSEWMPIGESRYTLMRLCGSDVRVYNAEPFIPGDGDKKQRSE